MVLLKDNISLARLSKLPLACLILFALCTFLTLFHLLFTEHSHLIIIYHDIIVNLIPRDHPHFSQKGKKNGVSVNLIARLIYIHASVSFYQLRKS